MRTRYSKPNSAKPNHSDHVELKTRRVDSVTRVYLTHTVGFETVSRSTKDFASYGEMLAFMDSAHDKLTGNGWSPRRRK